MSDTRIVHRECRSLVEAGYQVTLVGTDPEPTPVHGVRMISVPGQGSRLRRMTETMWRTVSMAKRQNAALYHFHDPELLVAVPFLGRGGAKVVYDAHEDLPRQVLFKHWIPTGLRSLASWGTAAGEAILGRRVDGVVAATPTIAARFLASTTVTVHNFPWLDEFPDRVPASYATREPTLAYVGGIDIARGAREMVHAMALLSGNAKLILAGRMMRPGLEQELASLPGASRTKYVGWLDRDGVQALLGRVSIGIVTLHPTPSYLESYPVKMFEYMAAGLPIIASDFPIWRDIVARSGCGILVDPMRPDAIARAASRLLNNPEMALEMGRRGQVAVRERYNWGPQGIELLRLYERLIPAGKGTT